MASTVEVLKIRLVTGTTPLRAFVDLKIGPWTINGFRVIRQDGQKAWVSSPQESWTGEDGKTKYRPIITVPAELKQRIDLAILSAREAENA